MHAWGASLNGEVPRAQSELRGAGGFGCGLRGQKAGTVAGPHDHGHRGERERQGTGDDEEVKKAVSRRRN